MTQSKNNPKAGMNRGAKLLLGSLSVATTLSGWAWLTLTAPAPDVQADELQPVEAAVDAGQVETISGVGQADLQPLPTPNLPRLANLPVRGLRYVGDVTPVVKTAGPQVQVATAPPQQQQQQQQNDNQPSNVSNPKPAHQVQPPPPPPPPPKPPPKRKTKSSRP